LQKIGILGGTFDPVHFGHLRIAVECKEALGLDELRMIPCALPSHRDSPHVNVEQRTAMLAAAIENEDGVLVDDRELKRRGYSYTVDTLLSLKAEFPESVLYLIVGSDSFQDFLSWHRWQTILDLANLVVAQRPGQGDDHESAAGLALEKRFCSVTDITASPSGRISFLGVSQLAISSTRIRELIKENKSVRYLLPDSVIEIIKDCALYKNSC